MEELNKLYIELNAFLKVCAIAGSGGEAKHIIRNGMISVNGNVELRNKRKLFSGDLVVFHGKVFTVTSDLTMKQVQIK